MTDPQTASPLPALPDRPADAHKGTFGTVAVVGGSTDMIGAPAIAAGAALRTGCGLARLVCPGHVLPFAIVAEPSATGLPIDYDAEPRQTADRISGKLRDGDVLAVGPGMDQARGPQRLVEALLRRSFTVVLDADGLNNLADMADAPMVPRCPLVMTPHPGEYQRLADAAHLHHDAKDPDQRVDAATALATAYGGIVVLKGRRTVIADADRHHVNQTGNPALATAGTGDVLTGMIASLIAQGLEPFDAAALGVHLHGLAADRWARTHGPVGLTARSLIELIPPTLAAHAGHGA